VEQRVEECVRVELTASTKSVLSPNASLATREVILSKSTFSLRPSAHIDHAGTREHDDVRTQRKGQEVSERVKCNRYCSSRIRCSVQILLHSAGSLRAPDAVRRDHRQKFGSAPMLAAIGSKLARSGMPVPI
jgi:hypothetical protein